MTTTLTALYLLSLKCVYGFKFNVSPCKIHYQTMQIICQYYAVAHILLLLTVWHINCVNVFWDLYFDVLLKVLLQEGEPKWIH